MMCFCQVFLVHYIYISHSCPEAGGRTREWCHGAEPLHELGAAHGDPAGSGQWQ